jgi:hypothetical protein
MGKMPAIIGTEIGDESLTNWTMREMANKTG